MYIDSSGFQNTDLRRGVTLPYEGCGDPPPAKAFFFGRRCSTDSEVG